MRENFTTAGLPAELAECMDEIARKIAEDPDSVTAKHQSFPNIIDFNAWFDTDNFDDLIKYKKLEMQLLAHGWSLVEKKSYVLEFSDFLAPGAREAVEDYRKESVSSLMDDDDDDDLDSIFGDDEGDDDLDIDGIFDEFDPDKADDDDFDMDFSDLFEDEDDEDDEDEEPAEKSGSKDKE